MTTTQNRPSTTVVDSPIYAWRNVAQAVKDAFYTALDEDDFVHDYRAQLDRAAAVLFAPVLTEVWAEYGYDVLWVKDGAAMQYRPHTVSDAKYGQVWDQACARLKQHAVVIEARLDDELLRYAAAHPRPERLAAHSKALRTHTQPLRDELHARLDEFAATADSTRAEAQLDGWRALVDTTTTYAQLEQLAADIPA